MISLNRPVDTLALFETACQPGMPAAAPTRYAIRQALDQEYQKYLARQNTNARQARYRAGGGDPDEVNAEPGNDNNKDDIAPGLSEANNKAKPAAKRDFFGRIIINEPTRRPESRDGSRTRGQQGEDGKEQDKKVWVSFHEGFSNAVRKPIALEELMRGFS